MREVFSKGLAALLACGVMAAVFVGCGEEGNSSDPDQAIAIVGDREVTRGEVELRRSIEAVGGKDSLPFYVVAAGMISEAYEQELAEKLGVLPTDREIAEFAAKIDELGSDEVLQPLRDLFDGDTLGYLRHLVEPQAVAAKLKRRFLDILPETEDGRAKMDRALELLRGETTPEIVAQSLLLEVHRDTLLKGGPATAEVKARYGDRVTTNPVVPLLDSLKPGQHLGQVLEDMVSYQIIEVVERNGDQVIVDIIEAPIYNYAMWFREQASDITVTMVDEELARTLREKLPNLWWAGMI